MKKYFTIFLIILLFTTSCEILSIDKEMLAAVKTGRPEECKKLKSKTETQTKARQNECFRRMAKQELDENICDMISEENQKGGRGSGLRCYAEE